MTFARVLETLQTGPFILKPQGFFNVESGRFTVSTKYFSQCDCYITSLGFSFCKRCEKGEGNTTVTFPSGDGDGIFVAYAILLKGKEPGDADVTVGMIAVFDYKFQIASYAREAIANETVPDFPFRLASQFEDCKAIDLGGIDVEGTLLIGNSSFSWNSGDAVVDIQDCLPAVYDAVVYCEEVDATVDGIADRLSRTQGMPREEIERLAKVKQASFEAGGADLGIDSSVNPFAPIVPRAIVVLHENLRRVLGVGVGEEIDEIAVADWSQLEAQFRFGGINLSHRKSMVESVIWENVSLGREFERAAGQCSDEEWLRIHFMIRSWLYQGKSLGHDECIKFLAGYRYQPSSDEEILMHMRRGLAKEASSFL